jgi:hypothetical protein
MRWISCSACVLVLGCSAIIEPDPSRLGGDPADPDAGPSPGHDAGPPQPDAGPPRPCASTGSRCEDEVLVSCADGVETRTSCTASESLCVEDRCEPWVCPPSSRECSSDNRGLLVCNARGDNQTLTPCELGCNPETNTCATIAPRCTIGAPRISIGGTATVDLCFETDDDTHQPGPNCTSDERASVGDETFVLTVTEATNVAIEVSDFDRDRAVDTLVYLRRVCDEQGSQLACSDDVACGTSTLPGPACTGVEVRQSRIFWRLEPGVYYVVVDAFEYDTASTHYGCGVVQLSVREVR